jgi:hypothetical protein
MKHMLIFSFFVIVTTPLQAEQPAQTETVLTLELSPQAAPRPVLKYRLLPTLDELQPGNTVHGFLKCYAEQNHFFFSKEAIAQREKYRDAALKDLRIEELKYYGGSALRRANDAARLENTDWQMLNELRRDGFGTLLPEIQQMRILAECLRLRARIQIARGEYDDALTTLKTLLRLGRTMEEHPTLIAQLVGIAIVGLAFDPLGEWAAQPDAPNLYPALTTLPSPMIRLDKGLQGEALMTDRELESLSGEPLDPAKEKALIRKITALLENVSFMGESPLKDLDGWLEKRAADPKERDTARAYLRDLGWPAKKIDALPPKQLLLEEDKQRFLEARDAIFLDAALPYPQLEAKWKMVGGRPVWPIDARFQRGVFHHFLTQPVRILQAQIRIQQRLALLQIIEALRLHAAKTGQFPKSLDALEVPVPLDPVTGKAFSYSLKAGTVTLRGTPPRGMEQQPPFNIRYVLTLRK